MGVVGKRVARSEGIHRVTGTGLFADDLKYHGMLHAAVVRSPVARGIIRKIDTESISRRTGINGVYTFKDIPGRNAIPIVIDDQPFLAEKSVNYIGEPVAVVVADSRRVARAAAQTAELSIKKLTPVIDLLEARNHPDIHIFGNDNIYKHMKVKRGDTESAFKACNVIIENEYRTPYQEHAYIEPQAMIAIPFPDGSLEIRGAMQCPFYVRKAVTTITGLPESKVRVIQCATGGAFGGKEDVPSLLACQVALPALKLQKPVKLLYDRTEDMISMSKRHPAWIRCKSGASKDGVLRAAEVEYVIDGGAYATLSAVVLFRGTAHSIGPYRCENVDVDSYAVATNKVPCGAFRGFGSPQVLFAAESQMDQLAARLGLDPVEFRKRNLLRAGDETITGQKLKSSVGLQQSLDKVVRVSGWTPDANKNENIGFGFSTIYYGVGLGAGGKHLARTGARVIVHEDGSVLFSVGTTEIGQGMITVLSQIAAEELGVPFEWVSMMPTDTSRVPDSGPTVASRSTTMSGNALKDACIKIRNIIDEEAAEILDDQNENIIIDNGTVYAGNNEIPFVKVIESCTAKRKSLSAEGWHIAPPTSFDNDTGQGDAYVTYAWSANLAKVKVDKLTGEVMVLRIWSAHDVGKAINPSLVEGQIEGGVLQGLGFALMEDMANDPTGAIINPEFSTYIIPTAEDQPAIVPLIIEEPYPDGPFGAKGFGEQPLMGIAPAIANAVFDAVGARIKQLPITPEKVWRALRKS
ncbi:MAG: xanthine dehydrogenase family protein [candidate division Zixibacteria bacterium]|nr:xanthine dehydrogenase family protein [candidate division Zixibacteria bacterium]